MKRYLWSIIFAIVLTGFTTYVLLDTFVISSVYKTDATQSNTSIFDSIESEEYTTFESEENYNYSTEKDTTNDTALDNDSSDSNNIDSYSNDNVNITIKNYYENNTAIYVADIQVASAEYLKTAFAKATYGKNVKEKTSDIASDNDAILAVNGDFYGAQESGYVIRNGVLYRDTASDNDVLCIYADGDMKVVSSYDYTADELIQNGVWQAFSFGPGLVENSAISVTESEEVGKAMASNPRTAVGMIDKCHYVLVVSDGRTNESEGLSLYQLAEFMQGLGCQTAYNLDGGGSSTMYFNGEVINNPTTNGNIEERKVSDIVYIAK